MPAVTAAMVYIEDTGTTKELQNATNSLDCELHSTLGALNLCSVICPIKMRIFLNTISTGSSIIFSQGD